MFLIIYLLGFMVLSIVSGVVISILNNVNNESDVDEWILVGLLAFLFGMFWPVTVVIFSIVITVKELRKLAIFK